MSEQHAHGWTPPAMPTPLPGAASDAGLRARDAWRCLRAACAPFRTGTLFQALPDVRFWRDGARLRAPGTRLPGRGDRSAGAWRTRLQADDSAAVSLRVDEPLLVDTVLWDAAHALLQAAWGADTVPVLPVQAALTLQGGSDDPPWHWPAGHARLVAVLDGRLRTAGGEEVGAGDALWLPDGARVRHSDGALSLVLTIAVDAATVRAATRSATQAMLLRLLDREWEDDGQVTMLPYPPASSARGIRPMPGLRALARTAGAAPLHATLSDAVAVEAALRASGLGLTPRPMAAPAPLRGMDSVRLRPSGIVRLRIDGTCWLVAVNGHALVAEDTAPWRRLWSTLCHGGAKRGRTAAGSTHCVDALTGRGRDAADLREWLDALHAAGGLRVEGAG